MKDISISLEAQVALLKLLARLNLLEKDTVNMGYDVSELCPIAFFARVGRYDEWDAINRVAAELGLKCTKLDLMTGKNAVALMDHEVLSKVGKARWRGARAIPIELGADKVTIALANPLDSENRRSLEFEIGRRIELVIAPEGQIVALLDGELNSSELFNLESILGQAKGSSGVERPKDLAQESSFNFNDLESPPVVRLVNKILYDAISKGASDIHIAPESSELTVRIRVDGMMQPLLSIPANLQSATISRLKLLSGMDITEKRRPQDGRLRLKTPLGIRDLRMSSVPALHGESLVGRILSSELTLRKLSELGLDSGSEETLRRSLSRSSGMVLVTGPTGSGKTSTLYSCLMHLHDGSYNVVTIEDPIEYRVKGITQIQVNQKIGMTFAAGLRSILRQDPDIVLLGEVRDSETADIALEAAQTGHLVLSTMHTNTAAAAITRLKDLGAADFLIASSLSCVVAARLVRKLCPKCCVADESPASLELARVRSGASVRKAVGCEECRGSGYSGRLPIFSVLEVDESVREAIRAGRDEGTIEQAARRGGFRTLEEAALTFVASGLTSWDEVQRNVGLVSAAASQAAATHSACGESRSAPVNRPERTGGPPRKRRVLLVEDDEAIREMLVISLNRELFEVFEAADGLVGLQMVYECNPDLIVCDLMMPKMNGMDLLQRIRADTQTNHIPVLMLTAADSEENELQLMVSGADDFVSKTAEHRVLLARIRRLIGRSTA